MRLYSEIATDGEVKKKKKTYTNTDEFQSEKQATNYH